MRNNKSYVLCAVIALSMVLCACGNDEKTENQPASGENQVSSVEVTPIPTTTIAVETPTPTPTPTTTLEIKRDPDFRNSNWGDSKEDVKKTESGEILEESEEGILYKEFLSNNDVTLCYFFDDGKLARASYSLDQVFSNGGQYLDVYSKWYDNLVEKYGEPDEDSTGIIKYVDQDTINYSGNALSLELGYIELNYKWTTENTRIFLGAWSENYETTVMISYEDINHEVEDDHLSGF